MNRNIQYKIDVIISTTLGAGFWPWGPGTAGAAVGMLIWLLLAYAIPDYNILLAIILAMSVLFTLVSIQPINRLSKVWGEDPSRVVIDETVGVWITMLAIPATKEWYYVLAAFLLFRALDITKPLGCRWLDRNVHGGWGVMLDDILAGIYGAIILWAITLL